MGFFEALGQTKENPVQAIQQIDINNENIARSQQTGRIQAIEEQKQQIVLNEAKRKEEQLDQETSIDHIIDFHKQNPSKQWDLVEQTFGNKFIKNPTTGKTTMRVRDIHNMVSVMESSDALQNKMLDAGAIDLANKQRVVEEQITSLMIKKQEGGEVNEQKLKDLYALKDRYDKQSSDLNKFRITARGKDAGLQAMMADETKNTKAQYDLLFKQANLEQKQGALELKEKYLAIDAQYKQAKLDMTMETIKMRADSVNTAYQNMLIAKDNQSITALNSIAKVHDQAVGREIQALAKADATPEQKSAIQQIGQADNTAMMMAMLARPDIGGKLSIEQKTDIGLKVEFATRAYEQQWEKITKTKFNSTPPISDIQAWQYMIGKWSSVPGMTWQAVTKKIANSLRISETEALDFYRKIDAMKGK